ncbi:hypothetical protein ABZ892_21170 [Streptomyces sp. NPDC046924]|uniref:hypothetical protein n=1 Tax=Streptomyces sp. NPDC046924 TaxID=3155136 RepID=UPI0033CB9329
MDPTHPERMEQVGSPFFSYEGLLVGDHGGQLVRDAERGRFIALACGGDLPTPGVTVRHGTGGEELLGGVHLIKAKQLELPFEEAAWDPALRLIDSRWHYAYANVTGFQPSLCFRPVLVAAAPDGDYDEDIRIRREDVAWPNNNEGFRFQRFGDRWYPLTSDAESRQCLVRDMAMRPHKSLDAPYPLGAPFPEVFPLPGANGRERWLAVTSDERSCEDGSSHPLPGYGVHGDVIVVRADHRQPETLRGQTCGTAVQPRGRVARPSSCAVRGSPVRRPCPGGIPAPGGVTALGVGRSAGGAVPVGPPVSRGLPP